MLSNNPNTKIPERIQFKDGDTLALDNTKYTVVSKIGSGGFGTVYKLKDKNQTVSALKVLRLWEVLPVQYPKLMARFKREYSVGKIASKFIIRTISYGLIHENPYINMEYCGQGSLSAQLHKFKDPSYGLKFAGYLLCGLKDVHEKGIIHRDIKPGNILFDDNLIPKFADFGISGFLNNRMTQTNFFGRVKNSEKIALGVSLGFSPPEQFEDRKFFKMTLPSMDMYALGSTLFYALSRGSLAFGNIDEDKKSKAEYQKNQIKDNLRLDLLDPAFRTSVWEEFFKKCLKSNPKHRIQDVYEAARMLQLDLTAIESENINNWKSRTTKIKVLEGVESGKVVDLDEILKASNKKLVTLGRRSMEVINDIIILEKGQPFISKRHATFEKIGFDWYIRDGQFNKDSPTYWSFSLNGLLVNGVKMKQGEPILLKTGDTIKLGNTLLQFTLD